MFKIIACFIITLFFWLYMRVDIAVTYGKHLHGCTFSLRGEVLAHTKSLALPLFIGVPVP
jgi:hypothetical protein